MDIRTAIWDARLEAKTSAHYFRSKIVRYQRLERLHTAAVALLGSGSIAAWLDKNASIAVPVFALAAVLLSLFTFSTHWARWVVEAEFAAEHWAARELVWDVLWIEVADAPDAVPIDRFAAEQALDNDYRRPSSPRSVRLLRSCVKDIHLSLGLPKPEFKG